MMPFNLQVHNLAFDQGPRLFAHFFSFCMGSRAAVDICQICHRAPARRHCDSCPPKRANLCSNCDLGVHVDRFHPVSSSQRSHAAGVSSHSPMATAAQHTRGWVPEPRAVPVPMPLNLPAGAFTSNGYRSNSNNGIGTTNRNHRELPRSASALGHLARGNSTASVLSGISD
jgi:hypothetical protein